MEDPKVEANRIRDGLASMPAFNTTATTEVTREVLLMGADVMCCGYLLDIKTKLLGAGVYKIWSERRK